MNPDPSKLRQQQQQKEQAGELNLHQESQGGQQFDSIEELIRFDAARNPPPDTIEERLKVSAAREPVRPRTWWQRLFGRSGR